MIVKMFSIYDSKAVSFLPPWNESTAGTALRKFKDAVVREGTDFNKWPEDYTLFEIGEFDDQTGIVLGYDHATEIAKAITLKEMGS